MPKVPRSPLDAKSSLRHSRPSAWTEVVIFGLFCANAGLRIGDVANRLDGSAPLGWWPPVSAGLMVMLAVWFGARVRRRLREAQHALEATPAPKAEPVDAPVFPYTGVGR